MNQLGYSNLTLSGNSVSKFVIKSLIANDVVIMYTIKTHLRYW